MSESIEDLKNTIKLQEEKILQLQNNYDAIFNHSKVGIAYINILGNFIEVNNKYSEIVGYSKEELLDLNFKDITHKEDISKDTKLHESTRDKGSGSFNIEKRYVKKDGTIIWVDLFVNHIRNSDGVVIYSIAMINDITKRKKIQNTILEQTKTMQMYLDLVDVMIVALNTNGDVTLVNRKACEILGLPEELIIGRNWFRNFLAVDDTEEIFGYFKQIINKEVDLTTKYQNDVLCKDNKKRTISWRNAIVYDNKRNIVGVISSGEDITDFLKLENEKKKNEQVLYNQSKMASMGEMLRNIAHQWRQPLSTISTAASGIKIQKELDTLKDEDFTIGVDTIVDTTKYLSQTIDDFQNYFKKDSSFKDFYYKDLLENVNNLVLANYRTNDIEFVIDIKSDKLLNSMFNELIQVIVNILNNAKDAFLDKNYENKIVQFIADEIDGEMQICIKDNAGGIPESIIDRIFEPYFTTKHQYLGTGIGLYMTKDIIENHLGGSIEAYNETINYEKTSRVGAVFKIKVPNINA